ncbi:unnamed protein product [Brassica rapa subsp. trilocularis]
MGFGFRFEPFRVPPSPILSTAAHASESPPSTAKHLHRTRLRRVSVLRCVLKTLTFVSRFEASPPQVRGRTRITTAPVEEENQRRRVADLREPPS